MSCEARYRRLGAHNLIRVPIRCVAIDTNQLGYKTEVLMSKPRDNVMAMVHNAIVTMDMHTPATLGQEVDYYNIMPKYDD